MPNLLKINPLPTLVLIIFLGAIFRFYGLNWDQSQHFHPDERMITMVANKIHLPTTTEEIQAVFTPQSSLNPQFFAYGSFPIYLLKIAGSFFGLLDSSFGSYDGLNLVGRWLSALFDLGTLVIIFIIGKQLFNKTVGLLGAFFYSAAVLPIQLSHFYAVDTPLTFFIMATLLVAILIQKQFTWEKILILGIFFGLALATKTSALVLLIPVVLTLFCKLKFSQKFFISLFLTFTFCILTFLIVEPFALIDFPNFLQQTMAQQQMTKSAWTFPYTLQYVGKVPYFYEIKNIFFWGLGPLLTALAFVGTVFAIFKTFRPTFNSKFLIINSFVIAYFLVTGSFAIGFMRYMLPLYPLLCLFAAYFVYIFLRFGEAKRQGSVLQVLILSLVLIWPLSFLSIYSQPNTRNQATSWILKNIPQGSSLAIEHWDDALPVGYAPLYNMIEFPLYDSDTPTKWELMNQKLTDTDYIIIASNRLYTPLMKLVDCPKLPTGRCYLQTAEYYKKLFDGSLGFGKVAEFNIQPTLSLFSYHISLDDSGADESFTVYDHPKIMIFAHE